MARLAPVRAAPTRSVRVAFFTTLALLLAFAVLGPADAAERNVSLGEVFTNVVRPDMNVQALFRASLERAMRDLDLYRAPGGRPVVLSVALQGMEVDASTRSMTCSVSVALRSAHGGALFATLESRARVALESGRALGVERRALDAAAHAALARVPEALR